MHLFTSYTLLIGLSLFSPILALLFNKSQNSWHIAKLTALAGLFSAFTVWLLTAFNLTMINPFPILHFTGVSSTVLLLVHFIGYVVLKYAQQNFELDSDNRRFLRWFLITLFSVMLTIVSNHLLMLWLGWVTVSISLHQLLMFYPKRYRAALAAHKKFIFARIAEIFLATAFLVIYFEHGTAYIDDIFALYPLASLNVNLHVAAMLISIVVLIKCAQLPLHGWLIQVVESPTPVSALLHAGIINMGGLLLLLFSPLFSQSVFAQILVLLFATISAVSAAMVMMSITSIKVRLAWSTIAQMGLMLIECALGLYSIALLHLVAHSVYKAHAFLSAGETVNHHVTQKNTAISTDILDWQIAATLTVFTLFAAIYTGLISAPYSPWIILAGTSIVLLANREVFSTPLKSIIPVTGLVVVYILLKAGLTTLLPNINHQYYWQLDTAVSLLFIGLLVNYFYIFVAKQGKLPNRILPILNAGFYLDEWSTRITLRIWPISLPKKQPKHLLQKALKHDIRNQAQAISEL